MANATIDGNRIGLNGHSGSIAVVNSVITNSLQYNVRDDFDNAPSLSYSDVWLPAGSSAVNFSNTPDQTGKKGNISADPKYEDPTRDDYRLDFGSPAIDAADGSVAPALDAVGSARYDDPRTPNTGTPTDSKSFADLGTLEFVETAPSNIDLAATAVIAPGSVLSGAQARITWADTNVGSAPAVGLWHDTINLVLNPGPDQTLIHVADVLVEDHQTLGPGQSATETATVAIPGALPDAYFFQVTANALGDVFEGANRANNAALALAATELSLPVLGLGAAPASGTFASPGQSDAYQINPTGAGDVLISLSSTTRSAAVELYAARGYLPTPEHFDFKSPEYNSATPTLTIPDPLALPYYVVAYSRSLGGSTNPYTLGATVPGFSLLSVTPGPIGSRGPVTVELSGGGFRDGDVVQLVGPGGAFAADSVRIESSTAALATFDLNGAAPASMTSGSSVRAIRPRH